MTFPYRPSLNEAINPGERARLTEALRNYDLLNRQASSSHPLRATRAADQMVLAQAQIIGSFSLRP